MSKSYNNCLTNIPQDLSGQLEKPLLPVVVKKNKSFQNKQKKPPSYIKSIHFSLTGSNVIFPTDSRFS